MRSRVRAAALAALACGLAMSPPRGIAGTIDPSAAVGGPGMGSASMTAVATPVPNNDDTSGTVNTVTVSKSFGSINPIDVRFQVANSGGVTEYRVVETVTNSSQLAWFAFHIELGFGGFAGTPSTFVPSGESDLIDFDTSNILGDPAQLTPTPVSNGFDLVTNATLDNVLDWNGGALAPGQSATFAFSIDLPDSGACAGTTPPCPGIGGAVPTGYFVTLREFPTITGPAPVPGPAALFLLSSGVAGLGVVAWRRQRA